MSISSSCVKIFHQQDVSALPFSLGLLLIIVLTCDSGRGNHIFDPEPEVTWTPPKNPADFHSYAKGANYSGLLYAGALEFNWIVDIRTDGGTEDEWVVANLVSYYHVLTTCKAINELQKIGRQPVEEQDLEYNWRVDEYDKRAVTAIRVYYCKQYLWEDGHLMPEDRDGHLTGSRSIAQIIRHPQCDYRNLMYDAAIIVMARGIPPIVPRLGYMPTAFDYIKDKTKVDIKLDPNQPINYASPVCYVASFGRNYANHREFYVLDYKIKIRVYITHWQECGDVWKYICRDDGKDCSASANTIKRDGGRFRYCFQARAKVGNVCDRDRGAPVVCNGDVIGLVIRGADSIYCNNLYKIPFVAERLDRYLEYIDKTIAYNVKPVPTKGQSQGTPKHQFSGASAHGATVLIYLTWWAALSNAIK